MEYIKIKILKDKYNHQAESCICCKRSMKDVLDMYIIQFGRKNGVQITICDECNEKLFFKTLRASVYTSTRLKDKSEIRFCNAKYAKSFDSKKSEDERLEWEEYYKEEEANESSDE